MYVSQCSVAFCKNQGKLKNQNIRYFSFPKNRVCFKRWVDFCENDDLKGKKPGYIYDHCRMCGAHFEDNNFTGMSKVRLKLDAVPTLRTSVSLSQRTTPQNTSAIPKVQNSKKPAPVTVNKDAAKPITVNKYVTRSSRGDKDVTKPATADKDVAQPVTIDEDESTATNVAPLELDPNSVKVPVFLYVQSPLDENLKKKIKSLIGYKSDNGKSSDDTVISNITPEQFEKLRELLTAK